MQLHSSWIVHLKFGNYVSNKKGLVLVPQVLVLVPLLLVLVSPMYVPGSTHAQVGTLAKVVTRSYLGQLI